MKWNNADCHKTINFASEIKKTPLNKGRLGQIVSVLRVTANGMRGYVCIISKTSQAFHPVREKNIA